MSRLKGTTTNFLWVPGPHYSELGSEGTEWAIRQAVTNGMAVSKTIESNG